MKVSLVNFLWHLRRPSLRSSPTTHVPMFYLSEHNTCISHTLFSYITMGTLLILVNSKLLGCEGIAGKLLVASRKAIAPPRSSPTTHVPMFSPSEHSTCISQTCYFDILGNAPPPHRFLFSQLYMSTQLWHSANKLERETLQQVRLWYLVLLFSFSPPLPPQWSWSAKCAWGFASLNGTQWSVLDTQHSPYPKYNHFIESQN